MYWTIETLSTTSGIGGLMVLIGLVFAATVFFPNGLTKGHVHHSSYSLDRDYPIWRWFKIGIAILGICLAIAGTLIQVYWPDA